MRTSKTIRSGLARTLALGACAAALSLSTGCQGGGREEEPAAAGPTQESTAPLSSAVPVFGDALASGWTDWSWATHNLANASPVSSGTRSISATFGPWTGVYFHNAGLATSGLATLDFKVNGGATAAPAVSVYLTQSGKAGPTLAVAPYCTNKTIPANAWTSCSVPLSALGASATTIDGAVFQEGAGKSLPAMYFDAIQFSPAATQTSAWIYRDALVSPWTDGSWATHNLASTSPVYAGTAAIAATMGPWQAISFNTSGFSTTGHTSLSMMVNGGASGANVALRVRAQVGGTWQTGIPLGPTCAAGAVQANAWTRCTIPLSAIAPAGAMVTAIAVQEDSGKTLPALYFDEVGVDVSAAPAPVAISISPATAQVQTGQSATFTASVTGTTNTAVTWSVGEGASGGSITTSGVYTAPASAGTYHVVATSKADTSKSATATVTVGSTPSTTKESWVWIYQGYSSSLSAISANKASFTHVSPTFYTVNYNYQSGVADFTTCPTNGSSYNCTANGPDNFDGLTSQQFTTQAKALGMAVVPAIYGGSGNGGTDTGVQNLLENVNGAGDSFITAMTNEAVAKGYNGYNIDWEVGSAINGTYADKFISFVNKFKAALAPHHLSLSVDAIVSNVNGTWCSGNSGFLDFPKLAASSIDRVIIEDYVSTLGTATNSCQNVVLSTSSPSSCDFTLTGELNMMCSPNLPLDKAVIGLEADPSGTNPIAGQAFSTIQSYGFTRVAVWPQSPFMNNASISPSGSNWYTLLRGFLGR